MEKDKIISVMGIEIPDYQGCQEKFTKSQYILRNFSLIISFLDKIIDKETSQDVTSSTHIERVCLGIKILMLTGMRVGNEDSAYGYNSVPYKWAKGENAESKYYKTYGLTTLLKEHIRLDEAGKEITFEFLGKKHQPNKFKIRGGTIYNQLIRYMGTNYYKGAKCFLGDVVDYDITAFLRDRIKIGGMVLTPKDFRTARANLLAGIMINDLDMDVCETRKEARADLNRILDYVSGNLCNTRAVCKKNYINDVYIMALEKRDPKYNGGEE